ncbi:serine/threonine-protein kinase PknA [Plesiocystis pacifica SIR-1]|uniref:Serine/threonine-protein kinase PknA n=1 Tax=Plesiocystis pacifica SIR-1 TaxID=391625 RepID=A6FWZ4_9BACT|nr:FHA domain-containing serine/threonine-protein kinase [Plesiocystis pacifica]EDM81818.1 serine/threonine-protein kinase PknA [Plesiocystis pacifica SIR-1]
MAAFASTDRIFEPAMESVFGPGDRYDEFVILRELGTGSFARVYAAMSPDYEDPIALKLSRSVLGDEATALRALREVRILETLTNPHVVHIHDHGMGRDDRWYMVMELLRGADMLAVHDFHEPMDPVRAVRWAYEACVGLDEGHRLGIVHRDIKPENLWIQPSDHLKVIDFGLARGWDASSTMGISATMGHMLVGTPHYSQPEQVKGTPLTPASDVYSIGIVLYELLSARMPLFPKEPCNAVRERLLDEPLEWLSAHVKKPLVPLDKYRDCRKRLPYRLIQIVHWMLQKDPAKRPQTGGAAARSLASVLHGELDAPVAGLVQVQDRDGARSSSLMIPGQHTIGTHDRCLIQVGSDGSNRDLAKINWLGYTHEAIIEPVGAPHPTLRVELNGHPLEGPVRLVPGTVISVGSTRMVLEYPPR